MDSDILKQNMDADGKQSIHVTPDEAELVRRLESGMTDEQRRALRDDDFLSTDGVSMGTTGETFPNGAPVWRFEDNRPAPVPLDSSPRPRLRPSEAEQRSAFYEEKDRLAEWAWNDIQTLVPTSDRMATPEMFLSNPMSTSGLAYVDKDMKPSTDMRGNRTPEHLQRNQDDIVSYTTSELARNMIEDLRMSMPRKMQDGLSGSMFVEVGRDGTHSLFTGNENTGYTELSFAPGDQGFRSAMDTVRKGFVYADANEDFGMDAGFWGRVTSAGEYQGYTSRDLNELLAQGMSEVKSYYQYDPFLAAEAMRVVDNIGDEQRRRRGGDDARALGYSRRVVEREIGRRAKRMMGEGRL